MFKRGLLQTVILATLLFFAVGCSVEGNGGVADSQNSGRYGTLLLGEEEMPINTVSISDRGEWLLVVISPLENTNTLTTNAIIGLKKELLDIAVDVEYKYCNADYILIYEDPAYYYAPFRPLQSGTIKMSSSGNIVSVSADVVLFDGTPFRYSNDSLPVK